jgi:hypothetical protein
MHNIDSETPIDRAGRQYRSNPDRYFHVMTEGWYIFTREGVRGPFYDKSRAAFYLQQHIQSSHDQPDPSSTWRL